VSGNWLGWQGKRHSTWKYDSTWLTDEFGQIIDSLEKTTSATTTTYLFNFPYPMPSSLASVHHRSKKGARNELSAWTLSQKLLLHSPSLLVLTHLWWWAWKEGMQIREGLVFFSFSFLRSIWTCTGSAWFHVCTVLNVGLLLRMFSTKDLVIRDVSGLRYELPDQPHWWSIQQKSQVTRFNPALNGCWMTGHDLLWIMYVEGDDSWRREYSRNGNLEFKLSSRAKTVSRSAIPFNMNRVTQYSNPSG
jgi:hypothetical protein